MVNRHHLRLVVATFWPTLLIGLLFVAGLYLPGGPETIVVLGLVLLQVFVLIYQVGKMRGELMGMTRKQGSE